MQSTPQQISFFRWRLQLPIAIIEQTHTQDGQDDYALHTAHQDIMFRPLLVGGEVVAKAQPGRPRIDRNVRHPALQAPRKTRPSVVHFPQQRPPARPLKSRARPDIMRACLPSTAANRGRTARPVI
ncbi:hypothetical protein CKAH01_10121 [Colletotrichum kahawae]|uniref:Uncharacterized protein n=1 Tax=Colletotrichum kahawae TaxID=34407 RepID=A0AAE0CZ54_COLKA|nr:hypothetical protein CKAH01_10121 [Colletotrichum kahawae]